MSFNFQWPTIRCILLLKHITKSPNPTWHLRVNMIFVTLANLLKHGSNMPVSGRKRTYWRTWIWLEYDWYSTTILFKLSVSLDRNTQSPSAWDVGWYFVVTCISLTFRAELSGLQTCSSACPARHAEQRCLSGLAAEMSAAAHFPARTLSNERFQMVSSKDITVYKYLPVRDLWSVCSVCPPPPVTV